MKKIFTFLLLLLTIANINGQVLLIGHNLLNNTPVANTNIYIKEGGITTKTLTTRNKTEFLLQLDFGKNYQVYFQNEKSPVMFLEVLAANVPQDKYDYRMQYELNIPLVPKDDDDIDTTVFSKPFHRVIFNGKKSMIDDSSYNNNFARNVLKKPVKPQKEKPKEPEKIVPATVTPAQETPSLVVGKVLLTSNRQVPVSNKPVSIIDKKGVTMKSTATNRFGAFTFGNIMASDVAKIKMDIAEHETGTNSLKLYNTKNENISESKPVGDNCEWNLKQEEVTKLIDNNYTSNIGGKLVSSSPKEKKFFANKNVYLSNKMNTVLKKTKTNLLGTFVFEDIKPDHSYFIGVDKSDLAPGERIDMLSKEDNFIASLDSVAAGRASLRVNSTYNKVFNEVSIGDDEMKMDVVATIFGDNTNTPIGKLKIILLNDNYEVIDSAMTNDFGTFKFKYLPFLKRFYLSAENSDNILDVFKNILIYSSDKNLIKIMTHQKGTKFQYKPVSAEMSSMRDIELEDPWLELLDENKPDKPVTGGPPAKPKAIVENILFETGKYSITPQSKEILDKIILVLNTNKQLKIEVGAHTDSKGNEVANMKLSELRAKTVQNYICKAGIESKRIISKGYGETRLLNQCADNKPCSEMEHAQNRRIEFKILGE
jgi:outer membrane protein OmpA-like peptidoglycan-associated protein